MCRPQARNTLPRWVFPKREGRSPPSLVVSRLGDFQGGREIEIPSPLNGVLWILSFAKERKYPVGDKKKKQRNANGRGRAPPLHTGFRRSFRRGRCPRSGAKRNKYPWGASPRRLTTAPLALFRRRGRPCPPFISCHSEPVTDVTGVGIRTPRPQARNTLAADCPKGHSAPRRGVLLRTAAKVPKNAVQTCGLKIPARLHLLPILLAFATRTPCRANFP